MGWETNIRSRRRVIQSLALLSGLMIQCCHELQYSLQMQLGSRVTVAVAEAYNCSSNLTLTWELPLATGGNQKMKNMAIQHLCNTSNACLSRKFIMIHAWLGSKKKKKKKRKRSLPGTEEMNLAGNPEISGLIPGLTQWVKVLALQWL